MGEKTTQIIHQPTSFNPPPPPGFRFYPSDQQLITHYLSSKNNHINLNGTNIIQELNIYNYDPFHLPDDYCFLYGRGERRRHWFCYVRRGGRGRVRRAGGGYWKRRGRERNVVCGGGGVVGTRRRFVFYVGFADSEFDVRTDWVMYEYDLIDHFKASFVLCRVFIKSHNVNNLLEHALSSCAEETVATVRHVGIQCDGTDESAIAEAKADDEFLHDYDNGVSNFSRRLISELDDVFNNSPRPEQVSLNNDLTAQGLLAILEDDFIELDDLVSPLPGID
ncbi:hypothetical protein LIER_16780 [Lithospermum erythrorhizon]|uniref:NAC domain-containing protein n=1 Tax=Lithospermum erythrorhizon TaxID=34254 RepID=A0AAV3Q9B4_LITER